MTKLSILRGDIFYANLDPVIGSEISKTRPVLIISNNINNKHSNTITVIPISTARSKNIYPFEVLLNAEVTKLKNDSIAKVNQIRSIDKQRILNKIAEIDNSILDAIDQAIIIHLDLNISNL